jgi:hypothetical protein
MSWKRMAWDTQERLIKAENAEKILQEKLFKQESKAQKKLFKVEATKVVVITA